MRPDPALLLTPNSHRRPELGAEMLAEECRQLQAEVVRAEGRLAAVELENARFRLRLERADSDMAQVYDATLEGWARALALRDHETEDHTRRVTSRTVQLARQLGVQEEELLHVRRGAMLHDIGKLGIPDAILLKPGQLTDSERAVMRTHPALAHDLLARIPQLAPALIIPYCHHEKWDGTGYPRGLVGEQIPFVARIFAVVDVWDALSSDRPYRWAWPGERARQYLAAEAGGHFDPQVVAAFLHQLAAEERTRVLPNIAEGI
jgi:HD-GYP domain-containing protein (c-di-GMP phosphodiesterase class II)